MIRDGAVSPSAGGFFWVFPRDGMGKVPVCFLRDGNGTGRWEATWLTGLDGNTRFLGGTERDGIGKRVGNLVGGREHRS